MAIESLELLEQQPHLIEVGVEVPEEPEINILDLLTLFEGEEFNDAQRAFTERALNGHRIRLNDLRREEFAVIALSKSEYNDFVTNLPQLKNAIVDTLATTGMLAGWRREEKSRVISYQLILGIDQKPLEPEPIDSLAEELRFKRSAPPEYGEFVDYLSYYSRDIRRLAHFLLGRSQAEKFIDPDDLSQEIALGAMKTFERSGPGVFGKTALQRIAENKLVDLIRSHNPQTRNQYKAIKFAGNLYQDIKKRFDVDESSLEAFIEADETTKEQIRHEVSEGILKTFPKMERATVQRVTAYTIDHVSLPRRIISFKELTEDIAEYDFPSNEIPPDALIDTRPSEELVSEFLDKFLQQHNKRSNYNHERFMKVARMYFIEELPLLDIATEMNITDSRVSQIINEAKEVMRTNVADLGLCGDEVAAMLGIYD